MANKGSARLADTIAAAAWVLFILQAAIGIYLSRSYSQDLANAHSTTNALGPFAPFHYYASGAMILLFALALLGMLWTGGHRWGARWTWWTTLGGLLLALAIQISGNALPMSQHDVHTVNVEANIAAGTPGIGSQLRELALSGSEFSQATIDKWYFLHRLVLPTAGGLFLIGFFVAASRRSARPSWLGAMVPVALIAIVSMAMGRPPDVAATPDDYSLSGAHPMWYVAPMHVLLLATQKMNTHLGWVGAMAIPAAGVLFLLLLPAFSRKGEGPSGVIRSVTAFSCLGFIALMVWTKPSIQNPFDETAGAESVATNTFGEIDKALAQTGRKSFVANRCLDCHKVAGEGESIVGPNLGKVGARIKDPNWYVEMLKDPASKGRSTMPAFDGLGNKELRTLAEYLRSLR